MRALKIVVLLLVLGGMPFLSSAQYSFVQIREMPDSVFAEVAAQGSLSDTTRSFVRHWQAHGIAESHPDSALNIVQGELESSAARSNTSFRGWLLYTAGVGLDVSGKSDSARVVLHKALDIFQDLEDPHMIGACMNSIGMVYFFSGDQNNAVVWYGKAASWWEAHPGFEDDYGKVLNNMAVIFRMEERYDDAIKAYQQAIDVKESIGDEAGAATSISNLGYTYSKMGRYAESVRCFEQALGYFIQVKDTVNIAHVRLNLGNALVEQDKLTGAIAQLQVSEQLFEQVGVRRYLPQLKLLLSNANNARGQYNEALRHARAAEGLLEGTEWELDRLRLYQEFAQAHAGLGQFKQAYEFGVLSDSLRRVVRNEERMKDLDKLQTEFDVQRTENELALARLEQARQEEKEEQRLARTIQIGVVMGVIILAALALIVTFRRNNRRLAEKNAIIEKSLGEKEVLLREIHHRVKNNLQMISSLLSIQARGIEDEKALEAVQLSRSRVKSMAIIHQNLYQEDNLTGIDMASYVDKLLTSLFSSYRTTDRDVTWEADVQDIRLDIDTAIPIGLILNELVTNALKHAFEADVEGKITVRLQESGNVLELEVADNGIGMDLAEVSDRSTQSYGMKMLRAFAEKLKATIHSETQNGTRIRLDINQYKAV